MPYYMPDTAFSVSRPKVKKQKRAHAEEHLKWIRTLPCLVSGKRPVHAAHIKYPDQRFAKRSVGIGEKSDDRWTVPLHPDFHTDGPDAQHNANEKAWWEAKGIDPILVASALWGCSGDDEAAEEILKAARND